MKVENFKENVINDDIAFRYNGKEYFIFLFNIGFTVGAYGSDDDIEFNKYDDLYKNREDMFNNWNIEGKRLKDIVEDIELL